MMMFLALGEQICKTAIWDRIEGWEVVIAVMLIVTAWAVVQVAKLYFVATVARIGIEPQQTRRELE